MEKFNYSDVQSEQESVVPEKIKHTNTILAKLALWGIIATNPLVATEAKTHDLDHKDEVSMVQVVKEDPSEKVLAFENRFKESGLISMEVKHEKPVVVVVSKQSIEENYSGRNGFIRTTDDYLSQTLILNFVNQGVDVVERGTGATNAIIKEAALGETGLIEWGQQVKLGNWSSADYYIVSSVERAEGQGDSFLVKNEVINMRDGTSTVVYVESASEHSDESIADLAQKTKSIIEEIESQKNGQK
jgi:hypothetical protein